MVKNAQTEVLIEDFTKDGEGIGHVDGYTLFVKGAVIGDRARVVITRPKKHYAYAKAIEILEPSADRVPAECPEARRCGGCMLQEYRYEAQKVWKKQYVENVLKKIGGYEDVTVRDVLGMEEPFRYRNKAQYPIAGVADPETGKIRPRAGFYAGHTHHLIPIEDCKISDPVNAAIVRLVLSHMEEHRILPYDEQTGTGLVRHLLIRKGYRSGEVLACIVINGNAFAEAEQLADQLFGIPGVVSLSLNVNREKGNKILGEKIIPVRGEPWIRDQLMGLEFRISPKSFYQVNPQQTEVLYREALKAAALTGKEIVYDLYCGIGTISLFLAGSAREVYGVEIVPDAIRDARENAERNGIRNAHFYVGAAEKIVPSGFFAPGEPCPHPDVVVLDPPRKGCDQELINAVLQLAPDRVVYVSCDPATLARDLKLFREGDGKNAYVAKSVQPVDMFPHTCHVETCVLLTKTS